MKKILENKMVVYVALALLILIAGYFGWMKYKAMQNTPEAQQAKAVEQKNAILNKIKALTVLPDEEPVLFTVNDANLLKGQQAFFKDAINGDVLMVFQKSGKALIYRESANQIVNSGPVSFQQPATTPAKTVVPAKK